MLAIRKPLLSLDYGFYRNSPNPEPSGLRGNTEAYTQTALLGRARLPRTIAASGKDIAPMGGGTGIRGQAQPTGVESE